MTVTFNQLLCTKEHVLDYDMQLKNVMLISGEYLSESRNSSIVREELIKVCFTVQVKTAKQEIFQLQERHNGPS